MIRTDFASYIKRGITIFEISVAMSILIILSGLITGAYFIVIESSKDINLISSSNDIYQELISLGSSRSNLVTINEKGLEVLNLNELNITLNNNLNKEYKLYNYYPSKIDDASIILDGYDYNFNSYNLFIFIDPSIKDRCIVTSLIDGENRIIDMTSSLEDITFF
jgi:hypothetical protein